MASISSILNPPTGSEQLSDSTNFPPPKTDEDMDDTKSDDHLNRPTSVTELLISRSNELQSSVSSAPKTTLTSENENPKPQQNVLVNARSRHLKKNDGEPYWRNEIQFKFLMNLFFNHHRVFKNPYFHTLHGFDWPEHFKFYKDSDGNVHSNDGEMLTFFELYLITLLKSNKISKILRIRLLNDINYALNFSIICLLVNIGRLNTTVNFDFEMKSQFRTYHSVPSLQIDDHFIIIENYYQINHENQKTYDELNDVYRQRINESSRNVAKIANKYSSATVKQLQDTPRIKSILKSVDDLSGKVPKTYPDFISSVSKEIHNVNLISIIFLISSNEYDIGQSFYPFDINDPINLDVIGTGSLLNDIWLRSNLNASDKVQKFLWLIYTLTETGLFVSKILKNPFNENTTQPFTLDVEKSQNIADEISIIDHKFQIYSPTILKLKPILPKWHVSNSSDKIELINDFDTTQEVEFASQMKHLRVQFVESENHNTTITNIFQNTVTDEDHFMNMTNSTVVVKPEPGSQNKTKRNKRSTVDSNDFSPQFYHPTSNNKSKNYSRQKAMESATNTNGFSSDTELKVDNDYVSSVLSNSGLNLNVDLSKKDDDYNDDDYNDDYKDDYKDDDNDDDSKTGNALMDHSLSNVVSKNEETDEEQSAVDNNEKNEDQQTTCNNSQIFQILKKGQKRPNDESIELSAIDPMITSNFEDNYEDDDELIGFFNYGYSGLTVDEYRKDDDGSLLLTSCVKKRKTRKAISVEPSIKNTINKIEAFLNKDNKSFNSNSKNALLKRERNRMISEFMFEIIKQKQSLAKNLRQHEGNWKHFTKHLWDLNMFVEKEHNNPNFTYQDWGEFKTSMFKVLTQVNCAINERIKINSKLNIKEKSSNSDLIDGIFAQL